MLKETQIKFKQLYAKKKDSIEWMLNFGNDYDQFVAKTIKDVALECF